MNVVIFRDTAPCSPHVDRLCGLEFVATGPGSIPGATRSSDRPKHRPRSTPQKLFCASGTHFCWGLSKPQGLERQEGLGKSKNVIASSCLARVTFRLVAECLNHYRTSRSWTREGKRHIVYMYTYRVTTATCSRVYTEPNIWKTSICSECYKSVSSLHATVRPNT
jgi:hypothetical protein